MITGVLPVDRAVINPKTPTLATRPIAWSSCGPPRLCRQSTDPLTHLATQWKDVALVLTGHAQSTEPETGVASSGRARRRATC